jgi:hypothetical protein
VIKIWTVLKSNSARGLSIKALALAGLITLINRFKNKADIARLSISIDIFEEIRAFIKVDFEQGIAVANDYIEREIGEFDKTAIDAARTDGLNSINQTISLAQKQFNQYAIKKATHHLRTKQAVLPEIKIKDSINRSWDIEVIMVNRLMVELQRYTALIALNAARAKGKALIYQHRGYEYVVDSLLDINKMIDSGVLHPNSSAIPFVR